MKFRFKARHWLVGASLCILTAIWPRQALPPGSIVLNSQPEGALVSVLQTSTRLPGMGAGGGTSLRPVGKTPGPLQISGADFPTVLVVEKAGYERQQLEVNSIGQLEKLRPSLRPLNPALQALKEQLWTLPLGLCLMLGGLAWRRERAEARRELAALNRLMQGIVEPGDQIADYRVERLLGAGGMGVVYLCSSGGTSVSLKLLKRQSLLDPKARQRLAREAEACQSLRHPGLLFLLDSGEYYGLPYLAYEFVPGQPLEAVARGLAPGSAERQAWAANLGASLAEALTYLHENRIVHRDLKPSNVLIDEQQRPRLMDFGIASVLGGGGATAVMGTPGYIAPEIIKGLPFDARVDGYALAALLYWAFTGREAFSGSSPVETMQAQMEGRVSSWDEVPEAYRATLQGWLEVEPDKRPTSPISEVYARLRDRC